MKYGLVIIDYTKYYYDNTNSSRVREIRENIERAVNAANHFGMNIYGVIKMIDNSSSLWISNGEHIQVFYKHGWDAFSSPEFLQTLKKDNIDRVVLCGIHTDKCVDYSIIGAQRRGFNPIVLTDCVQTNDTLQREHHLTISKWLNKCTLGDLRYIIC